MDISGNDVKYATIELAYTPEALKEATNVKLEDIIEFGLFVGIRKLVGDKKEQEFLLIIPPKGKNKVDLDNPAISAFARDKYNIVSLEWYDGSIRTAAFAKAETTEQKQMNDLVDQFLKAMADAGKVTKDIGVIDVKKYSEIPVLFKDPVISTASNLNVKNGNISTPTTTQPVNRSVYNDNLYAKDKKATFFKRKTKNPHHQTLKSLKKTLDKIDSGDYIEPKWPETKGNTDNAEDNLPGATVPPDYAKECWPHY